MTSALGVGRSEAHLAASSSETGQSTSSRKPTPNLTDVAAARARAERKLVERVFGRCHGSILPACAYSSVPPQFLGALTANESGGNPKAARFEPGVYDHLKAVAAGKSPAYSGVQTKDLDAEIAEVLHPKSGDFHARYLSPVFGANHRQEIAALEEEALRELSTSWGFTQIMGYHMLGRNAGVQDLLDPQFHFRLAIELLAEFAEHFQLDLASEFREMFRCWNTGGPYGKTHDPQYVEKGLQRMEIYRELIGKAPKGTQGEEARA